MKSFFSTAFLSTSLAMLALSSLSSCNKDPEPVEDPNDLAVTLEKGEATEKTLSFTVSPVNAEKCTWWYGTADQEVPSAEEILAKGNPVTVIKKTPVLIEGLMPATEYVIVAAVSSEGKVAMSDKLNMVTADREFDGESFMLLDAVYSDANAAGAGNYSIALGNAEVNENWEPKKVGDMFISLELFNERDSDPINAVLPNGEYKAGQSASTFTWNPSSSYLCVREDETASGVKYKPFISGVVDVARTGNTYSIYVDLSLLDGGEKVKVKYEGPIQFIQGATAAGRFEEPQNVTFKGAQGRYFGNWYNPFCDDMTMEFYAGEIQDGKLVDGYWLQMQAFMNKLEDTSVRPVPVESGNYRLGYGIKSTQYLPLTFKKGEQVDFNGMLLDMGTYLKHIDSKTGRTTIGFVVDGNVKISGSGSSYSVEFNFVTEEGVELKGTYNGAINLENRCDNSHREVLESTLKEDYKLNFPADTKAEAHYLGDYLHVGLDSWLLYFMGDTKGDTIMLEFFTEKNTALQLPEVTYTVGDFKTFKANYIIPGFYPYGGGDLPFSWYGDASSVDAQGYSQKLAPLYGGTMKVSKDGKTYVFDMNFKDDKGHAITGQWKGDVSVKDWTKPQGADIESFKKHLASKVR